MMTTKHVPVLAGAESFFHKGNEIGILLCHGFAGTPQSVGELGKLLAAKGYTVYAPRLKGHGTTPLDFEDCCFTDWIQNIEEAYKKLKKVCRRIFVAGQSMGGILAAHLACRHQDIDGLITINAALSVPGYEVFQHEIEPRFIPEGKPDIKADDIEEITYEAVPIKAVHNLLTLIKTTKPVLSEVTCPTLIFKSEEDHVVPASSSDVLFHAISSPFKQMVSLTNSYHVASMDFDKDVIAEKTAAYIELCCSREYKLSV